MSACARALATLGPSVVVHGGGQAVSAWSRRLGLPVEKRDGLRVTTPEIAQLVEMVLGGPINRMLVTALRAAGLDAIDRKSTRLNSSHRTISYAVFCLKKKKKQKDALNKK